VRWISSQLWVTDRKPTLQQPQQDLASATGRLENCIVGRLKGKTAALTCYWLGDSMHAYQVKGHPHQQAPQQQQQSTDTQVCINKGDAAQDNPTAGQKSSKIQESERRSQNNPNCG
jgi:uncharacterized protein YukE